jgi:hypothetical protein
MDLGTQYLKRICSRGHSPTLIFKSIKTLRKPQSYDQLKDLEQVGALISDSNPSNTREIRS